MSGRGQVSVFTTSANSSTQNCIMCNAIHDLFGCQEFKNMNPDDRFDFAFKNRLCFNCLLPGHISSRCNINRTCTVRGCDQRHTKFLHTGRRMKSPQRPTLFSASDASTQTDSDVSSHASCSAMGAGVSRIALPIVPVIVSVPGEVGGTIETFALLDSGSTNSFCLQEIAEKIQTKGRKKIVSVSTLEAPNHTMECEEVKLSVKGSSGTSSKKIEAEFLARPSLNISAVNMATEEDISRYQHLFGIDLQVTTGKEVSLLIGQDMPEALMPLEVRTGAPGEVYAIRTALGWTLNGPLGNESNLLIHQASSNFVFAAGNIPLGVEPRQTYKLERVDRDDNNCQLPSHTLTQDLQNNPQVTSRQDSLKTELDKNDCLYANYREEMKYMLEDSYAKVVLDAAPEKYEGLIELFSKITGIVSSRPPTREPPKVYDDEDVNSKLLLLLDRKLQLLPEVTVRPDVSKMTQS
ncbi:uncharacterized protein LOC135155967 [Lytechinus pictus]|uniref:uncharacterized protein LOC135155967 n=1 Tax=Lytechinus pictus TaxID=7653 RepID=UPI0030B9CCE4